MTAVTYAYLMARLGTSVPVYRRDFVCTVIAALLRKIPESQRLTFATNNDGEVIITLVPSNIMLEIDKDDDITITSIDKEPVYKVNVRLIGSSDPDVIAREVFNELNRNEQTS